jgi:hypothetical protein
VAIIPLTNQEINRSGTQVTYTGSLLTANTYTFPLADTRTFVHLKKTGAGTCTVTIVTPGTTDGFAIADHTYVVIASTGDNMAGPFRPETFADPTTGLATMSFGEITGLTVAVFHLAAV